MAEIRDNFIKSKMNKDLDSRLIQPGEYRDAQNIAVSKSEGEDVGALENVLGNVSLTDFGLSSECNLDIIGFFAEDVSGVIYVFITNYIDTSTDLLSNFAPEAAKCYIAAYNTNTGVGSILVQGNFLNFSKASKIYGVNYIGEFLFWSDNRNQPRKINTTRALNDISYYTNEDQISVAKIYPHKCIQLVNSEVVLMNKSGTGTGYTVQDNVPTRATLPSTGFGLTFNILTVSGGGDITSFEIADVGQGYEVGDVVTVPSEFGTGISFSLSVEDVAMMEDVVSEKLPDGITPNPLYDANFSGDKNFLKDKFVRFAYRYKFEDGEYSLISPFTQPCFVPEQDGYFIGEQENQSYKSTEIEFMQNKINNISLLIPAPGFFEGTNRSAQWSDAEDKFKVSEVEIIYKQSDQTSLKVLDSKDASAWGDIIYKYYRYNYKSEKPYKTLPDTALLRVYDQTPLRSLGQEVAGNRVIYGNYIDKGTPPANLDYVVSVSEKLPLLGTTRSSIRKEYQNHTLKQNRSYQVGVVLSDRYGRQSTTILSSIDSINTSDGKILQGSTVFAPYKAGTNTKNEITPTDFSYYPGGADDLLEQFDTWAGDSLKITFNSPIQSVKSDVTGEPGLYSATNPTGWYSYKIVVKQSQQEYYNIFFPGLLNGYIDGESAYPLAASDSEPIGHIAISSDNINKIPRDLSLVGPNQLVFRTGRPSFEDDPSYYEFLDTGGTKFVVDPYTEEGENILKTRDRERDLDSGSQINNASVKLFPRVMNYAKVDTPFPTTYTPPLVDPTVAVGDIYSIVVLKSQANDPTNTTWGTTGRGMTVRVTSVTGASKIDQIEVVDFGSGYIDGMKYEIAVPEGGGAAGFRPVITFNLSRKSHTSQWYPGQKEDVVVTVGSGTDLGLWSPTAVSPYNRAPVFFGYQNNPLIGKIELADYTMGAVGPSVNAHNLIYSIETQPSNGLGYAAGSQNISTQVVGEDGGVGILVNIEEVDSTTGEVSKISISNANSKDIKGYTVGNNVLEITGAGDGEATFTLGVTKKEYPGLMTPAFSVYETTPIDSKLDIYWETSTSGLIEDLNDLIEAGDIYTPRSLDAWNFNLVESFASGLPITDYFFANDTAGNNLTTAVMEINSVIDNLGNERKTDFDIEVDPVNPGKYRIKTASLFYYGATGETYTFYIKVTAPSSVSNFPITSILSPNEPTILGNASPNYGANPLTGSASIDKSVSLEMTPALLAAKNGSFDSSRNNLGLTWDVIIKSGPSVLYPDNAFSVSQFTPNLGIPIVSCLALTPNGTYTIELNVQDEGGLSTSTFAEAQRLTRVVTVTGPEVG